MGAVVSFFTVLSVILVMVPLALGMELVVFLEEIINQALHKEYPEGSILLDVPGYAPELVQAAEDLGLDPAGTIPNYLCHDDKLYHRYYYVVTSERWYSTKD